MKKILKCLKELGYVFYDEDILDGYNEYLRICISYSLDENVYCVRYALLSYFDRWANSGFEAKFKTAKEVINFFENEKVLLVKAMNEVLYHIVEKAYICKGEDKDSIISHLEDMLQNYLNKIYTLY